jgi:hypothetical protein
VPLKSVRGHGQAVPGVRGHPVTPLVTWLDVDGLDQRQHLRIGKPLALRTATALTGPLPTDADFKHTAQLMQFKALVLLVNPGVLHRASLAKYAAAFLRNTPSGYGLLML